MQVFEPVDGGGSLKFRAPHFCETLSGVKLIHPVVIGRSIEGREIEVLAGVEGGTLLIGGIHGDEPATISLVREFLPCAEGRVALLPVLNPDGAARGTRYNSRGVDLNRNFGFSWRADSIEPPGPGPWSEPESRALRDFILAWRPARIVALHWALGEIDADGAQSTPLATAMWDAMSASERSPYRLRVTPEAGRDAVLECPGSLGQWAGWGLAYPDGSRPAMITLELPHEPVAARAEPLPEDHVQTVRARWARDAEGYLADVRGGIGKMLRAACAAGM